jgi:signal transduction histidine kinase/DNA-binding response OmpR family regulator/CHASE3 domain sensor protein
MNKSTSFNTIVVLGFLLAIIIVVAVGFIAHRTLKNLVNTVESISEPVPVVQKLHETQSKIMDSEKVLKAYSITQNREYFALYVHLQRDIQQALDTLQGQSEELTEDVALQIAHINHLLQNKLDIFNEYIGIKRERNINGELEKILEDSPEVASGGREMDFPEGIAPDKGVPYGDTAYNELMSEIESVLESENERARLYARPLSQKEMELAEKDRTLTEHLRIAIASVETQLEGTALERANQARQSAISGVKLISGFMFAGAIIFLFLVYFIVKYNIRNNRLQEELIREKEAAERSTRLKEEFMANMSHEIRTPMNVIMGFTEQLLKPGAQLNQRMYLVGIRRSTEHLLRLINDILDYSKIESGKLNIETVGFRWKDILDDVYLLLREKAEQKNLEFGYTIKDAVPDVLVGDPVRLKQILLNLVDNAIKFTQEGKVEIICEKEQDNGIYIDLKFTVKDTGIGINKNKIEDIFEQYSQAEAGTTRKYGGSGLGLSISKRLVELQGGQIRVKSTEGKGSEFIFSIPYHTGKEKDVNVERSSQVLPLEGLKGKKILVVDDEEFNRQLAKVILEQYQIDVREAENGMAALDLIQKETFDAILMDIQMPDINGVEVVKKIRSMDLRPEKANMPVIALTANAKKEDLEHYIKEGMNDYLSKPFKEQELMQKLAKALNLKPSQIGKEEIKKAAKSEKPLYNLEEIKKITRGDEAFLKKIIELFIENTPSNAEKLKQAAEEENWEQAAMLAHKLRPSFAHMGMKAMAEDLRIIEDNATEKKELDKTRAMVKEFYRKSAQVVIQLEELINHHH